MLGKEDKQVKHYYVCNFITKLTLMKVYNMTIPAKYCQVKLHGVYYQTLVVSRPRLVFILGAQLLVGSHSAMNMQQVNKVGVRV